MDEAGYAEFVIEPTRDQVAVVNAVTAAIEAARRRGVRRLLVDLRPTDGMVPPTLAQRDTLVTLWARAAAGLVAVAVVAPPSLLDPERFGEMVAAAAGMQAEGFEDRDAARAWLARQDGGTPRAPSAPASPRTHPRPGP